MSDNGPDQAPGLEQQVAEFTANPRTRRVAALGVKAYLVWGAFVLLLALAVFGFVAYQFVHIGG